MQFLPKTNEALSQLWYDKNLLLLLLFSELHHLLSLLAKTEFLFPPHTTAACCLRNQSLTPYREEHVVRRTKKGTDCRFTPKTFIQKLHTLLSSGQLPAGYPHHQGGGDRGVQLMLTRSSIRITLKNNGPWRLHKCYRKITSDFNVLHDHTALCFNYNLSFMPKDI